MAGRDLKRLDDRVREAHQLHAALQRTALSGDRPDERGCLGGLEHADRETPGVSDGRSDVIESGAQPCVAHVGRHVS